jgi:hypothetical protein
MNAGFLALPWMRGGPHAHIQNLNTFTCCHPYCRGAGWPTEPVAADAAASAATRTGIWVTSVASGGTISCGH